MYRRILVLILLLFIFFQEDLAAQREGVLTLSSDPYGYIKRIKILNLMIFIFMQGSIMLKYQHLYLRIVKDF